MKEYLDNKSDEGVSVRFLIGALVVGVLLMDYLIGNDYHPTDEEYCARVAIYEQTKDTDNPRGHRDFENRGCSDDQ